jgi:Zn-dependent alcohol dehydrogenase
MFESKLEAAKKYGATHTINASKDDAVSAIKDLTSGGVDQSFEAIGNPITADQTIQSARAGGTATLIGALVGQQLFIKDAGFAFREVTVRGVATRRSTDVIEVLDMVQQGRIDVSSFITKRYPYQDINTAIDDVHQGNVLMGVVLWGD